MYTRSLATWVITNHVKVSETNDDDNTISVICKGQPLYIVIYKTIFKQLLKYIQTQFNYLSKIKWRQSVKNNDDGHTISIKCKCQSIYNKIYKIILNN